MTIGMLAIAGLLASMSVLAQQGGLVDPTRPSSAAQGRDGGEAVPVGPVLQSTMVSASRKRAVISGQTYEIGDRLGAAVITDIRPYEVVLDQGGRVTRLRIVPALVKDAARADDNDKTRKIP